MASFQSKMRCLDSFLEAFPLSTIQLEGDGSIRITLEYHFSAKTDRSERVEDTYELEIIIPSNYPHSVPTIYETGGRIPPSGRFHVNEGDGSLCLGSHLRLLDSVSENGDLKSYLDQNLVPFLYTQSLMEQGKGRFIFGELPHGVAGELEDYKELFGLKTEKQVQLALELLEMPYSQSKKKLCPCGCNQLLKKCSSGEIIKHFRKLKENQIDLLAQK